MRLLSINLHKIITYASIKLIVSFIFSNTILVGTRLLPLPFPTAWRRRQPLGRGESVADCGSCGGIAAAAHDGGGREIHPGLWLVERVNWMVSI